MDKDDPIQQIATQLIDQAVHSTWTEAPLDADAVHELRVLSKKLRALLRLYLSVTKKSFIKSSDQQLKQFADSYAISRDANVVQQTLARLVSLYAELQAAEETLLRDYFSTFSVIAETNTQLDPRDQLNSIDQNWPSLANTKTSADLADGIDATYRKACKLSRQAVKSDKDDDYHRCRKWIKFYLYQIELLVAKLNKEEKKHRRQVKKLASRLGLLHDLCELEKQLLAIAQAIPRAQGTLAAQERQATQNTADLERASAVAINWLQAQKASDKHACQKLFAKVFRSRHAPVIHQTIKRP